METHGAELLDTMFEHLDLASVILWIQVMTGVKKTKESKPLRDKDEAWRQAMKQTQGL